MFIGRRSCVGVILVGGVYAIGVQFLKSCPVMWSCVFPVVVIVRVLVTWSVGSQKRFGV